MTKSDRFQGDVEADWVSSGAPLSLAEARYLRDVLRRNGIRSKMQSERTPESPTYCVLVRRRDYGTALELRQNAFADDDVLGGEDLRTSRRKWPALIKVLTAGILGAATGARVGVKFQPAWVTPLATLVFAAFAAAATLLALYVFRSQPPPPA
jgi:hypothetical protein